MKMKNLKRMIALGAAVALSVSILSGCGKKNINVTETGEPVLATAENSSREVATVNGESITVADLQYYIYNVAMMQLYTINPEFTGDVSGVDWQQKLDSGKTLEETVIEEALETAIADLITVQKGAEQGIALLQEEKSQMDEIIDSFIATYGEEAFTLNLTAMGLDSKDEYKKIYERVSLVQRVEEDIQADLSKYVADTEKLKEYKSEDKATVQHVLIMTEGGKHENPEEVANEVLTKAKAGEDFVALIDQYNEDPGATAAGYTFGPGEMVKEFEEASFALDFDQISDIVKTDYGYHIIKRLVGTAELQNYWKSEADIKEEKSALKKLSVADVVNAIVNAQTTLQEQSQSEAAAAAATTEETKGESNNG